MNTQQVGLRVSSVPSNRKVFMFLMIACCMLRICWATTDSTSTYIKRDCYRQLVFYKINIRFENVWIIIFPHFITFIKHVSQLHSLSVNAPSTGKKYVVNTIFSYTAIIKKKMRYSTFYLIQALTLFRLHGQRDVSCHLSISELLTLEAQSARQVPSLVLIIIYCPFYADSYKDLYNRIASTLPIYDPSNQL